MVVLSIGSSVANEKTDRSYTIARKIANEAIVEAGNAQDRANDQMLIIKMLRPKTGRYEHEVYIWNLLDRKAGELAKKADKLDLLAHRLEPNDDYFR